MADPPVRQALAVVAAGCTCLWRTHCPTCAHGDTCKNPTQHVWHMWRTPRVRPVCRVHPSDAWDDRWYVHTPERYGAALAGMTLNESRLIWGRRRKLMVCHRDGTFTCKECGVRLQHWVAHVRRKHEYWFPEELR